MRVSLELVPRSEASVLTAAATAARYPAITDINIPDLLRFPVRSWEACAALARAGGAAGLEKIPHLRAIDFDPDRPFPHAEAIRSSGIRRVLAIAGDPPQDMRRRVYPTTTVEFIRKLKRELPDIQVFAAFDPYRSNIRYELDYLKEKEDAGADGFMSQPFFDLRLLEIYAEYLEGRNIFWGVSPVVSEASRDYWETRNRAVFPKSFVPELEWNVTFARRVLAFCEGAGFDLYLMPIKADIVAYLSGVFGDGTSPNAD